ncbi:hypothetical protein HUU40_17790 [candidate division KSB1 bacterium]|nr:hypothetical protein [candidate division KSB1 bacterium]
MSTTILVKSEKDNGDTLELVKSAVEAEITRLTLALEMAEKRLLPYEKKYHVDSEYFLVNFAAEDLEGGDEEYVSWAGEYKLKQSLQNKIVQLREIEYAHSEILQSD